MGRWATAAAILVALSVGALDACSHDPVETFVSAYGPFAPCGELTYDFMGCPGQASAAASCMEDALTACEPSQLRKFFPRFDAPDDRIDLFVVKRSDACDVIEMRLAGTGEFVRRNCTGFERTVTEAGCLELVPSGCDEEVPP